jgi:hypothetical protein
MALSAKEKIKLAIICLLEAISVYILIIVPIEYFLTEYFLVFKYISGDIKTYIFLAILLIILWLNYIFRNKFQFNKIFMTAVLILTVGLGFGYKRYLSYYGWLQTYPKIFNLSHDWGIQRSFISIEGKNFGPTWQPGKVYIKDNLLRSDNQNMEFIIKFWSPDLVIIEQPVPERFFKGQLYLQKFNGRESNPKDFEIKDPSFLKTY